MAWKPDYATTNELKSQLRIADTVDDTQIGVALTTASRAIDTTTGRQFGQLAAAAAWSYTPIWDRHRRRWLAIIDDLVTLTGMIVAVDGTTTTDYTLEPTQAVTKGMVYYQIVLGSSVVCTGDHNALVVTAQWGWPSVPVPVKQACLLQASRFLARRDSPYGIAGSPSEGSEMRLLALVDPDVRVSLGHYLRRTGIA